MKTSSALNNNFWILLTAFWFIVGLSVLGWRADAVIFSYIFETSIIGAIAVAQMIIVSFWGKQNIALLVNQTKQSFSKAEWKKVGRGKYVFTGLFSIFIITMFVLVFFGFVWGQSIFVFTMLSGLDAGIVSSPTHFLQNFLYLFTQPDIKQAFIGILLLHLFDFVINFIGERQYDGTTYVSIFTKPWLRIFVQQLVVILGAFLYFSTGGKLVVVAVLLIIIKTATDIFMEKKLQKWMGSNQSKVA